jgi:hypothetical protein
LGAEIILVRKRNKMCNISDDGSAPPAKRWVIYVKYTTENKEVNVKPNSHTPRRSYAAPMPFPCHAVPLSV